MCQQVSFQISVNFLPKLASSFIKLSKTSNKYDVFMEGFSKMKLGIIRTDFFALYVV